MKEQSVFPRHDSIKALEPRTGSAFFRGVEDQVREIIETVRSGGESRIRQFAQTYDSRSSTDPLFHCKSELLEAFEKLSTEEQGRFQASAVRIRSFAEAQRGCFSDLDVAITGGRAGHRMIAVENAGCYVPGGRYPLPSSLLMTVIPARVAGVRSVWVATPRPDPIIMATAWIAGADGLLAAGGAHGIAALAFGVGPVPPSDVIVGPGNQYVTAAKKVLAGEVRIDMLAGPTELIIIADGEADPTRVAADLLAQAEHDEYAFPLLISLSESLVTAVEAELAIQLDTLSTATTARISLRNGGSLLASNDREAARLCDTLAPEHVQVCTKNPQATAAFLQHYGALFLGQQSAEVFGDYGAGPNHVLPTGRSARTSAGLSVFTFLRFQTWLALHGASFELDTLAAESAWFARLEGLEAHARAVELRIDDGSVQTEKI
ncbi:MAG: histidinol dehydrogenase [Rhodothermia bacterium]|nr:MAG: histidinol dehydrogenase [Rhodothermia bacterium]